MVRSLGGARGEGSYMSIGKSLISWQMLEVCVGGVLGNGTGRKAEVRMVGALSGGAVQCSP